MQLERGQGVDVVDIIIEAPDWARALPEAEQVVERAAAAAFAGAFADACTGATRPGPRTEAAILLADDATVRELNRRFRGQDKPTNVLSFAAQDAAGGGRPAAGDEAPPLQWGDVVLAYETVAREAAEQGKTLAAHLSHLVVHGLLHLFGHDHAAEAEAERMEALERAILGRIGIADPYGVERAE